MRLSREQMLERMYASDKTSNGRFLTGVVSTGIYCLPSCPARKPNAENVVFYQTEADYMDSLTGKQAQNVVWVLPLIEELDLVPRWCILDRRLNATPFGIF